MDGEGDAGHEAAAAAHGGDAGAAFHGDVADDAADIEAVGEADAGFVVDEAAGAPHRDDAIAGSSPRAGTEDADDKETRFIAAARAACGAAPKGEQPCLVCLYEEFCRGVDCLRTFKVSSLQYHYKTIHREVMRNKHHRSECPKCKNWFVCL